MPSIFGAWRGPPSGQCALDLAVFAPVPVSRVPSDIRLVGLRAALPHRPDDPEPASRRRIFGRDQEHESVATNELREREPVDAFTLLDAGNTLLLPIKDEDACQFGGVILATKDGPGTILHDAARDRKRDAAAPRLPRDLTRLEPEVNHLLASTVILQAKDLRAGGRLVARGKLAARLRHDGQRHLLFRARRNRWTQWLDFQ